MWSRRAAAEFSRIQLRRRRKFSHVRRAAERALEDRTMSGPKNVVGTPLKTCCLSPRTGFYRTGGFPGLKPGDRWCLCAARWKEALRAGVAPPVLLEATHISALEFVNLDDLQEHALDRDKVQE
jgi:uncharacterized protein (DUF2237 family)